MEERTTFFISRVKTQKRFNVSFILLLTQVKVLFETCIYIKVSNMQMRMGWDKSTVVMLYECNGYQVSIFIIGVISLSQ